MEGTETFDLVLETSSIEVYLVDHVKSVQCQQGKKLCMNKCQPHMKALIHHNQNNNNVRKRKKKNMNGQIIDKRSNNESKCLLKLIPFLESSMKTKKFFELSTNHRCSCFSNIGINDFTFDTTFDTSDDILQNFRTWWKLIKLSKKHSNSSNSCFDISSTLVMDDLDLFYNIIDNHNHESHQISTQSGLISFNIPPHCSFVMGNILQTTPKKILSEYHHHHHRKINKKLRRRKIEEINFKLDDENLEDNDKVEIESIDDDEGNEESCCLDQLVNANRTYSIILMDPPWTSKSVSRANTYQTFPDDTPQHKKFKLNQTSTSSAKEISIIEALKRLPLKELSDSKNGTLLGVWCTNNQSFFNAIVDDLFPSFGAQRLFSSSESTPSASSLKSSSGEEVDVIYWMKMAGDGNPIYPLNVSEDGSCSCGERRPFERLLLAFIPPSSPSTPSFVPSSRFKTTTLFEAVDTIDDLNPDTSSFIQLPCSVFVSVPLRHSWKPMVIPLEQKLEQVIGQCRKAYSQQPRYLRQQSTSTSCVESDLLFNANNEDTEIINQEASDGDDRRQTADARLAQVHHHHKLELFARELRPGWTSVGDEAILFQDVRFFH